MDLSTQILLAVILATIAGLSLWLYRVKYIELCLPVTLLSGAGLVIVLAFLLQFYLIPVIFIGTAWWYYGRQEALAHWHKPLFVAVAFLCLGGMIIKGVYTMAGCADSNLIARNQSNANETPQDARYAYLGKLISQRYEGGRVIIFSDSDLPPTAMRLASLKENLGRRIQVVAEFSMAMNPEMPEPRNLAWMDKVLNNSPSADLIIFMHTTPPEIDKLAILQLDERLHPDVLLCDGYSEKLKRESVANTKITMVVVPHPEPPEIPPGTTDIDTIFAAKFLLLEKSNLPEILKRYPDLLAEK